MSRKLATEMFRVVRGMKPNHKYVFMDLAWHFNDNPGKDENRCDPGEDLIAEETGYKPRQVGNIIRELVCMGRVVSRVKRGWFHHCNEYDLFMTGQELLDLGCTEDAILASLREQTGKDCTIEEAKIALLKVQRLLLPWCKDCTFGTGKDCLQTGNAEQPKAEREREEQGKAEQQAEPAAAAAWPPTSSPQNLQGLTDAQFAGWIARTLEPDRKKLDGSVKLLLPLVSDPGNRNYLSGALSMSLVVAYLKNKLDHPVAGLIAGMREGWIDDVVNRARRAMEKRQSQSPLENPADPPEGEGQDEEDSGSGKPVVYCGDVDLDDEAVRIGPIQVADNEHLL